MPENAQPRGRREAEACDKYERGSRSSECSFCGWEEEDHDA